LKVAQEKKTDFIRSFRVVIQLTYLSYNIRVLLAGPLSELTQKDAAKVVDALLETISNTLAKDETI